MTGTDALPSVGVVIPCWNYGAYLPDAIDSALSQTLPFQDILVVDDGSTDDTRAIAEDFALRFPDLIRYLPIAHSGVSAARNRGAATLTTDFVVFLDADDKLHPEFNEACAAALAGSPVNRYVYTDMQLFGATEEIFVAGAFDLRRLARSNFVHPSTFLPLELVRRYGYREHLMHGLEDWDLYLSLAEAGVTGIYLPRPLFLYRQHDRGRTRNLREHPFLLAKLRVQLARDHASLYSRWDVAGYLVHVLQQLRVDLGLAERIKRNLVTPGRVRRLRAKLSASRSGI